MSDTINGEFRVEDTSTEKVWLSMEDDDSGLIIGISIQHRYHSEKIEDALASVSEDEIVRATLRSLTSGEGFHWVVEDIDRSGGTQIMAA